MTQKRSTDAKCFPAGEYDQLHHFIADGVWDAAGWRLSCSTEANWLVGGDDAVLVIDDTAVPKKGEHSVGVAGRARPARAKRRIAKQWCR